MVIDLLILAGLAVNLALGYKTLKDIEQIEGVVGQMLYDLGEQGILNVEVHEDA